MLTEKVLNKIATALVVLYPLFFRYQSFIAAITVSEFVMIVFLAVMLGFYGMKIKAAKAAFPFWIYLLIQSFAKFLGNNIYDEAGTGLRLVFLYFAIAFLIPHFDYVSGIKYVNLTAVFVSLYGLLQIAVYPSGRILPTELPLFVPYRNAYAEMLRLEEYGFELRIRSLFGEPSELCSYLILPLTINLFTDNKNKYSLFLAFLYSAVCVVSKSSTGIIIVVFLWTVYFFRVFRERKKESILILPVFFIGAAAAYGSGIWSYFMNRTFGNGLSGSTRFASIQTMFDAGKSVKGFLFGAGMAETDAFLPGFARLFYWLGAAGILLYFVYLFSILCGSFKEQKYIWLIYFILNIGSSLLMGSFALPYMCFMGARIYQEKMGEKQ